MGKIIKRIWAGVSHGDTVWGIMNVLFPSLVGAIGGIITWLTSLHPGIIFLSVLFGIAFGLLISNELSAKRIQQRLAKQGVVTVVDKVTKSKETATVIPEGKLTQEQVAERLAFIQHLRAVAERLLKNSQGGERQSIKSIAYDICIRTPVREYIGTDGLACQTERLLTHQLDDFLILVSDYQGQAEGLLVDKLDNTDINSLCNTTRELVLGYRRLVFEVMVMFTNLQNRGVEALWHLLPWSVRINQELADNYDELMRLVVDLKTVTPSYARDLLPKDEQTSKFARDSLWEARRPIAL